MRLALPRRVDCPVIALDADVGEPGELVVLRALLGVNSTAPSRNTQPHSPGVKVPQKSSSRTSIGCTAAIVGCRRIRTLSIAWLVFGDAIDSSPGRHRLAHPARQMLAKGPRVVGLHSLRCSHP